MPPKKRFSEVVAALAGMQRPHSRGKTSYATGQSSHSFPRSYGGEYRATKDEIQYFEEIRAIPLLTEKEENDLLMCMRTNKAFVEEYEGRLKEIDVQIDLVEAGDTDPKKNTSFAVLTHERATFLHARDAARASYEDAYQKFTAANLRLVVSLARGFLPYAHGMRLGDLVQEGNLGLMRAVSGFDVMRGLTFSTFAIWWIGAFIERAITTHAKSVRVPDHIFETNTQYMNRALKLHGDREAILSAGELDGLINDTGKSKRTIENAREAMLISFLSLDGEIPYGHGSIKLLNFLSVAESKEDQIDESALVALVHKALGKLLPRSRFIIEQRHGIFGPAHTLEEIGSELGVSRERVRQLEKLAMEELGHWLRIFMPKTHAVFQE